MSGMRRGSTVVWLGALALCAGAPTHSAATSQTPARPHQAPARIDQAPARLDQAPLVTLFPDHPRLIIGGYRGVAVAELRAACAHPDLRGQCDAIGGRHVLDDAMRWVLFEDGAAAGRVAAELRGWNGCTPDDVGVEHVGWGGLALAYDWTWDVLPADVREDVQRNLVTCGLAIGAALDGNGPHLWHGYTSLAAAMALMALASDRGVGHTELVNKAVEQFRGNALEAYAVVGGAWPEGYNYMRSHFFSADPPDQFVVDAIRAWDSAVERDWPDHASIFDTIAEEEGDWLRGLAYHIVYGTIPRYGASGKLTLLRGGDMPTGQAWPNKQVRPFVDSIARAYGDGVLAAWGRDLEHDWPFVGGDGTYHSIHRYGLPYNLPLDVPSAAADDLPLGMIWGRADLGYVITRSGWGDDAAVIGYRAGKWFTGHQHMDQGHLDIWRRGPLAVDAGVYANWGTQHREAFYMRTAAHNTLLVHRAGEDFEEHPGSGVDVNDDGQRVHTYNRRGCPQCMQSVAEWSSHVGAGMHFEAGRIDAFEDAAAYTVVQSDITAAYNSRSYSTPGNVPKVDVVQRDLVYWRPDLLVVVDRVRTLAGAGPPRFALHLPARPEIADARVVAGAADNGILESESRAFRVDNGTGGRLVGQTLWPDEVVVAATGGPEFRYWVDGANRAGGAAPHEASPAEPGTWRIEVAPRRPASDTLLVHALHAVDAPATPGDAVARVESRPGLAPVPALEIRATLADGSSLFLAASAGVPRRRLAFAGLGLDIAEQDPFLITDLEPGARYRVAFGEDLRARSDIPASAEGVVAHRAAAGGTITFGICPAPPEAPPLWEALCGATPPTAVAPTGTATPFLTPPATPSPGPSPTSVVIGRAFVPRAERSGMAARGAQR